MASGWRQDDVRNVSRMASGCVMMRQDGVRMTSGKCQDSVRMASGNVRIVEWRQERARIRQDGVRMASGWRQDASGWRQASVTCVLG